MPHSDPHHNTPSADDFFQTSEAAKRYLQAFNGDRRPLVFIAMPTKGSVLNKQIRPEVLAKIAALHLAFPQYTFIAPMIQDYQLLAYMPHTDATWEDWGKHCRTIIERSDEVWVLKYKGWDTSVGVAAEIAHAETWGRRITYLNVEEPITVPV